MLTVGASDRANAVASFSSRSRFVDLAAPGVEIPIATALGKGWRTGDGTSFAAPLVSGASAWVWTVRPELDASQLFEVMRRSAQSTSVRPGETTQPASGCSNVPAALAYPAPVRDPARAERRHRVRAPGGLYDNAIPPLTTKTQTAARPCGRASTGSKTRATSIASGCRRTAASPPP